MMIKFACWNINGFKLENEHFYKQFDIFGISESWTIVVHGTKGNRKKGRRSGSIIVYVRENLFQSSAVLPVKVTQNFIWIKVSKEAFQLERDIFICTLYIPPRIQATCPKNDQLFEHLKEYINEFSALGNIMLMGDFNARTGIADDFIELDHICQADEAILPSDYLEDLLLPKRFNVDKIINEQGQHLLDLCIETRLRILYPYSTQATNRRNRQELIFFLFGGIREVSLIFFSPIVMSYESFPIQIRCR